MISKLHHPLSLLNERMEVRGSKIGRIELEKGPKARKRPVPAGAHRVLEMLELALKNWCWSARPAIDTKLELMRKRISLGKLK